MSCGDCKRVTGESDDTTQFVDLLLGFKLRDTQLDRQATNDLAELCLAKFDDTEASMECRAIALYTVVAQITSGNALMLAYIPDICMRLQTRSVLLQSTTGAGAEDFHREVINAISVVLNSAPEKLVNESFPPVMHYLARLVSCENVEIAIIACEFWVKYAEVPTVAFVRRQWIAAFEPELSTLIAALMEQMIYRPAHAEHLVQFSSRCSNTERPTSLRTDVELFANLRNLAAYAFEQVAG